MNQLHQPKSVICIIKQIKLLPLWARLITLTFGYKSMAVNYICSSGVKFQQD